MPISILREMCLFKSIPGKPTNHAATLEQLEGRLLCVWYSGQYEVSSDLILMSSSFNEERCRWNAPKIMLSDDRPLGNPVLFKYDGKLYLFYVRLLGSWWDSAQLLFRVSLDDGHSWSQPKAITEELGIMIRNKPIISPDGRIILPAYDEKTLRSLYFISTDGEGWEMRKLRLENVIQPSMVFLEDNRILTVFRNPRKGNAIFGLLKDFEQPDSIKVYTCSNIKNPNSALELLKLKDNRLLLLFNNSEVERTPLSVAVSEDGVYWSLLGDIERGLGEYSYPSAVQDRESELIHVCYTARKGKSFSLEFKYHAYGAKIKHTMFSISGS